MSAFSLSVLCLSANAPSHKNSSCTDAEKAENPQHIRKNENEIALTYFQCSAPHHSFFDGSSRLVPFNAFHAVVFGVIVFWFDCFLRRPVFILCLLFHWSFFGVFDPRRWIVYTKISILLNCVEHPNIFKNILIIRKTEKCNLKHSQKCSGMKNI